MVSKTHKDDANFLDKIDKLIHEPARLNILVQLHVIESADFLFLMNRTGLTHGNLSSHMTKLEKAGYLTVKKEFVGRRPHTMICITDKGRVALQKYLETMKHVIDTQLSKQYRKRSEVKTTEDLNVETYSDEDSSKTMSGSFTTNLTKFRNTPSFINLDPLVADLESSHLPLMWLIGMAFISLEMTNLQNQEPNITWLRK
ncbi:winged helix-turn-helix domain-containing protein [Thermoproteota archaeon]